MLNTTWEAGKGLVSASGTPLLLGGANSTNVVAGEAWLGAAVYRALIVSAAACPVRPVVSWCVITRIALPFLPACPTVWLL